MTRCIFCKKDSSESRSVEHILPESLGNTKQILPIGIVCDQCNNYFARKIEKPFMELETIQRLRFNKGILSKKKKIPPAKVIMNFANEGMIIKQPKKHQPSIVQVDSETFNDIIKNKTGTILILTEFVLENNGIVSRFVAKVAFEVLAQRLLTSLGGIEYLIVEKEFDPIRNFVRLGQEKKWNVHIRRIYEFNKKWIDSSQDNVEVVYEYDIFLTELGEMYFVMCLFGLELVINYGGPSIDGYIDWLMTNNQESPLYLGRNKHSNNLKPVTNRD